jgi:hypothetical protein
MLDNQLLELITATSEQLDLEDSVIEKDYFVTQVIHALSKIENEYFRLVFCGGTCLSKAHKIVNRMSEDVDFKIQLKKIDVNLSKTKFLKELKGFRLLIRENLNLPGITTSMPIVRNEGQYSRIDINYPSFFPASTRLRSHILLEFTVSNIHLATTTLPVKTLIEDTLENIAIFPSSSTHCISVENTAIEKWVGLTRRLAAIERKYHPDDETLIRHVYDLNAIKQANKINVDFFALAKIIVGNDAKQFKNQHPEYSADPGSEIQLSLTLLKNKPLWKERYQNFIEEMVYDSTPALEYESAINVIEQISVTAMDLF